MDFADEHYVKLFTRDTVTWRSWPWQSKALFPLLMRVVDHAGILSVGTREPARSVALMVMLPEDVVTPGLEALLADETVELVGGSLIITRFVDAQESRKTNAQAKREQREKAKAMVRAAQVLEATATHRQTATDGGRSGHPPSPALLCPALPEKTSPRRKRAAAPVGTEPDRRHAPLVAVLEKAWGRERPLDGSWVFTGRDAKAVTSLLAKASPEEIGVRWSRALSRTGFPTVRRVHELDEHWTHFGPGAVASAGSGDPNGGIITRPPAPAPSWNRDTPAGRAFIERLDALKRADKAVAVDQLQKLTPELDPAGRLTLWADDPYFSEWCAETYSALLEQHGGPVGFAHRSDTERASA